ncbi:MAG: response regulator, partial [Alphaproteobacteria bacterium]|nr:response regulator [Alphaproteobacteria bacterium]
MANQAQSTFLANMSHELRTPMNAILGFTQVLQWSEALSPKDREHLEVIHRSGCNLLALINDVLEMSKIEAGRVELTPQALDLYELLDDLDGMFRVAAGAKGLQWGVLMAPQLSRLIVTDERKLRQILINLIGNAVKFTETGGVVLRAQVTGHEDEHPHLVIEVEDTGVGISPEELGWLFDPFRQTASGIKKGGTGLGLAISRRHARLMDGDITVGSVPGQGSVFRLELPVKEEIVQADERKAAPRRRILGLRPGQEETRILIVDDKPDNRLYLTRLLEPLGFVLREGANGCEAIALWQEWRPQLIVMDIVMPVMDGREAIRRIKALAGGRPEGGDVVIVAVSASAFEDDREAVIAIGADEFLRKPVTAEELLAVIGQRLKVEYDYAADGGTARSIETAWEKQPLPDMIDVVPADLLDAMRQRVSRCDDVLMMALIDQLPPDQGALASRLRSLTMGYDWEALEALVGRHGNTSP